MPPIEIPEVCEFEVGQDEIHLLTQTNGDEISIHNINLQSGPAAVLAYLINWMQDPSEDRHLTVEVKKKV